MQIPEESNKKLVPDADAFALIRSKDTTLNRISGMSMGEIGISVFKSKHVAMGRIVDMNKNGLSFKYIDNGLPSGGVKKMDILLAEHGFYLNNLPFKTIYDKRTDSDDPFILIKKRCCSVKFMGLSTHQKVQLEHFLEKHASEKMKGDLKIDG